MNEKNDQGRSPGKGQRGAFAVLTAVGLFVLAGIGALAIDVGYGLTTRSELQNVADAAALAGARYLGEEYRNLPPSAMPTHSFDADEVYDAIQEVASQNEAANLGITIRPEDVRIGLWDPAMSVEDIHIDNVTLVGPDAVRVIARRDGSVNGPISTFFAQILNIDTMNVASKSAIAALTGPSWVEEGDLMTPFALSGNMFPNNCQNFIQFSPTKDSCASWHNFFDAANASALGNKLLGLIQGYTDGEGSCENCGDTLWDGPVWLSNNFDINVNQTPDPEITPSTSTGDSLNFIGGQLSTLFTGAYLRRDSYNGNSGTVDGNPNNPAPMFALFDFFRYRDGDGNDAIWTATIPVYKDSPTCENDPSGEAAKIIGFANIEIIMPVGPPNSEIRVRVDCDFSVIDGRGSGSTFGNLRGTIPNLVK